MQSLWPATTSIRRRRYWSDTCVACLCACVCELYVQIEAEEHACVLVGRELEPVVDDVHGYGLATTTVTGA